MIKKYEYVISGDSWIPITITECYNIDGPWIKNLLPSQKRTHSFRAYQKSL